MKKAVWHRSFRYVPNTFPIAVDLQSQAVTRKINQESQMPHLTPLAQPAKAPTKRFLQKIGGAVAGTLTREAGAGALDR